MTIEERLENLERELGRQKRRYRWLLGAVLLVAGTLVVPGFFRTTASRVWAQSGGTAKELRARRIVLEDENGHDRVGLSVYKDGPSLTLLDENSKNRFVAGKTKTIAPDGKIVEYPESSLILFGPDSKVIWSAIK